MRLIDADAMHKFVEDKVAEGKDGWKNGVPYEWAYALTAVDMQPTVEATPVVHGRWKYHPSTLTLNGSYTCTACGSISWNHNINKAKYCPFCGAKMDGLPICHGDCGTPTPEEAWERLLPKEDKPRAIYLGFSSHDCESRYKCPVCGALFGSWDIHREENENGTKKCCPDCKTELSWPK